ncbi:MAG: hypothetical protein ACK5RA_11830, partial [Cyanobacteriota bacterium]
MNQDSVDIRQNQIANTAAVMLSDGALALFVTYFILVAFDALPARLLDPAWMLNLALSLSGNMVIPLAALAFIHVAAWMTPMNNAIQARRNFFGSIARWAMIGFLLLIPLIGYATWAGSNAIKIQNEIQNNAAKKASENLAKFIGAATSPGELQAGLIALNGPNIPNQSLNQPLPLLKKQALLIVNESYKSFQLGAKNRGSEQLTPFFVQALKALLLSAVGALASAALSWNPLKQQSMLSEIVMGDFQQLKLALNPKRMIANYKLSQEQRSLTEDARKRVREIEQQRQVEARKNAAAARKQSLERKREMDKFIKEEK